MLSDLEDVDDPSLYPRDRVDLGRQVSTYTTPEAPNLKYFLFYQLGHSVVGNHFFTFSPLSSSCLVACISENVPQLPILRYYWRVASEKVLTVRTRTFQKRPFLPFMGATFQGEGAGGSRRIVRNVPLDQPYVGLASCAIESVIVGMWSEISTLQQTSDYFNNCKPFKSLTSHLYTWIL